jgi:hypothetical protein
MEQLSQIALHSDQNLSMSCSSRRIIDMSNHLIDDFGQSLIIVFWLSCTIGGAVAKIRYGEAAAIRSLAGSQTRTIEFARQNGCPRINRYARSLQSGRIVRLRGEHGRGEICRRGACSYQAIRGEEETWRLDHWECRAIGGCPHPLIGNYGISSRERIALTTP